MWCLQRTQGSVLRCRSARSNPIRGVTMQPLAISEIFKSIQGEGPSLGRLCAFVRLGGCNLTCNWCDSSFTWDWTGKNGQVYDPQVEVTSMSVDEIMATLDAMNITRVVITGGEPLLQQNQLLPLLREIKLNRGWHIEVETNGTVYPLSTITPLVDQWNVSPKIENSGV